MVFNGTAAGDRVEKEPERLITFGTADGLCTTDVAAAICQGFLSGTSELSPGDVAGHAVFVRTVSKAHADTVAARGEPTGPLYVARWVGETAEPHLIVSISTIRRPSASSRHDRRTCRGAEGRLLLPSTARGARSDSRTRSRPPAWLDEIGRGFHRHPDAFEVRGLGGTINRRRSRSLSGTGPRLRTPRCHRPKPHRPWDSHRLGSSDIRNYRSVLSPPLSRPVDLPATAAQSHTSRG